MRVEPVVNHRRHDRLGRAITYLRLSVTDRCNLRCRYCVPAGESASAGWIHHGEQLTNEEILRVVTLAAQRGLSKVRITGGEPLVRPGIVDLVAGLARIPGITDLPMSTNGLLLARYAEALKKAGLHRVNVSLDTLDPAKFARITGGDALQKVWEGIEAATTAGLSPVKLNVVVQRGINDDEWLSLARLTLDRPYHVRFIEYMPVADFARWQAHHVPNKDVMRAITHELGPLLPCARGEHDGPAMLYTLDGAVGRLGFISAISDNQFCDRCNRLRLSADGRLQPCLFSPARIDLRTALRSGCDDDELHTLFDQAIDGKPATHELSDAPRDRMLISMMRIGG